MHEQSYHRHRQGIALVVVLLSATVLIVALLAITSTLAVSSRRTTTDQRVTLQAQYAAESGLSRARNELGEVQAVMRTMRINSAVGSNSVNTHIEDFCDKRSLNPAPARWTPELRREGVVLCEAAPASSTSNRRFSLFTSSVPGSAYPDGTSSGDYWRDVFGSNTGPTETLIATDPETGAETWYRASFGLTPKAVRLAGPDSYRFEFEVAPVESTGEVRVNGEVVATRSVRLETPNDFAVSVERPSFSRYVLFRNNTRSVSGGQLYFAGGESFGGPVHTNGTPGLAMVDGEVPEFYDEFTTAADSARLYRLDEDDYPDIFQGGDARFDVDAVPLPTNNNNQLRASFGGDAADDSAVGERDLTSAWNVSELRDGLYYSEGDGSQANQGTDWNGGLYVKGDVADLTLSTDRDGRQVIRITREETVSERVERRWVYNYRRGRWELRDVSIPITVTATTTFTQEDSDTWRVEENGSSKELSGDFNGMIYVDGDIASLSGDGTGAADIAADSQLTLTTTGDITVKDSITYTDNPLEDEEAQNVLGIYTDGGSVLLDGPRYRDLNLHATVMASREGEGFGTVNPFDFRGYVDGDKARINLLGGVIEDQSQTVGNLGTGGYERNYTYDARFSDGLAPPFFPTQVNWTSSADAFSRQQGLWEFKSR